MKDKISMEMPIVLKREISGYADLGNFSVSPESSRRSNTAV